jgi:hypothetical protein
MKVFLSHAHQDTALVQELLARIPQLLPAPDSEPTTFVDTSSLTVGGDIRKAIIEQVRRSDFVVLFWTVMAADSPFVGYELGLAHALNKRVLVVVAPDAPDLPESLGASNEILHLGPAQ